MNFRKFMYQNIMSESKEKKYFDTLEKTFGKKNMVRKASQISTKEIISTGFDSLDECIGNPCEEKNIYGGIPLGIIMEVYGPEASGKGVTCLHILAEFQKKSKRTLWVDSEKQSNPIWMEQNGVDINDLDVALFEHAISAEQTMTLITKSIPFYDLIVVDSISALIPKAVLDAEAGDKKMAELARVLSSEVPKIMNLCAQYKSTVIFINQVREKIGVMFGNPETTSGGNAIKFYSSLRIRIQGLSEKIVDKSTSGEQVGTYSRVDIVKNRFGPPKRTTRIPIYYYDYNPNPVEKLVDLLVENKILKKYKGNYRFNKQYSAEDPFECFESIYESGGCEDLLQAINSFYSENAKKNKANKTGTKLPEKITDPDIVEILKEIQNDTFDINNYRSVEMVSDSDEASMEEESEKQKESNSSKKETSDIDEINEELK